MCDDAKKSIQDFEDRWENQKPIEAYMDELDSLDVLAEIEAEID